ncbi:MAG: hypothetical protein OEW00_02435 [candidate division Zixibacteria bacterium]|nr:hypothetical protein [candidate division Zixibacteria bacterium]
MDKPLEHTLDRALRGDQNILSGFGFERMTTVTPEIVPGTCAWEEKLTVRADGHVSLFTRRSITEASSEIIGHFESSQDKDALLDLIRLVKESPFDRQPRVRIDPGDVSVRLRFVIGGAWYEHYTSPKDPRAMDAIGPLLQELDRLGAEARHRPVMALELRLEMPDEVKPGENMLPVNLTFANPGREGFWVTHPGSLDAAQPSEHCRLLYGRQPEIEENITPLPMEIVTADLKRTKKDDPPLIWIPAEAEVRYQFVAKLNLRDPGTYLARAAFSSYSGEDIVGGQPRLRGCVFSNEVRIRVF